MKDRTVKSDWGVLMGGRWVNGGNKGEGMWLMGFIYTYETEQ
jgi:hypothetical protein